MMTLAQLMARFPDEQTCREHLKALRWPENDVRCPRCRSREKVYKANRSWRWVCKNCTKNGYGFSLTTGTIFENTKYPLRTWFQVLYLMLQSKKGMSALQIQRTIGAGSYETAWYMCHRLRAAMKDETFRKLTGVVEIDETYVGGKAQNAHRGNRGKGAPSIPPKTAVIGAIARKGNVVAQVIEDTDRWTMERFVRLTVNPNVSLVATDEHAGYARLNQLGFSHGTVKHKTGEYAKETVHGNVHTANLDSFWSLLKRGVVGTFHKVSKDYLPLYLNEFSFRHNHRQDPDVFDRVLESC